MSAPSTINGPAQTVGQIIQVSIYDVAKDAAENALLAAYPVLLDPFLHEILTLVLDKIATELYSQLSLLATLVVIDIEIGSEKTAYVAANQALAAAHLSGDPNAIAKAVAQLKSAAAAIIHYDGSYSS